MPCGLETPSALRARPPFRWDSPCGMITIISEGQTQADALVAGITEIFSVRNATVHIVIIPATTTLYVVRAR